MTTLAELFTAFQDHAAVYYRTNRSALSHCSYVRDAVSATLDLRQPADDFGPLKLQSVRETMIRGAWPLASGERAKPWCRSYINKQVARLVAVFRWGVSQELVTVSVVQALDCVPSLLAGRTSAIEGKGEVRDVPQDVVAKTLPYLPSDELRDLVTVQMLCGARGGELLAMRPCDLTFSGVTAEYRPAAHKKAYTGKKRVIILGPRALAIVRRRLPLATDGRIFPGYSPTSYRNAVSRAADRAGVEHWHVHQLRHAACTSVAAKYGIEAASHVAGHGNVKTTEIYAHHGVEKARDVMRDVG